MLGEPDVDLRLREVGERIPIHDEVKAIQSQTFKKITSTQRPATFAGRVISRLKSEFFGQPLKRKIWFIYRAVFWRVERLRAKIVARPSLLYPSRPLGKLNDNVLRVAVHGTGSLGDFFTHDLFIQEFYRQYGPMEIDLFCHPKKVEDAKFLFGPARNIKNVVSVTYLPALEYRYDIIVYIHFLVKYRVINADRVLEHSPDLLNAIGEAEARFEPYTIFFQNHPLLDGMMARNFTMKGMNLADMVGYVGNVNVSRKTFPLLIPSLTASTSVQKLGLEDKQYITVHDGFDTSYVPAGETVTKCWPIKHWKRFIALFKKEFPDFTVVQLGTSTSRKIDGVDLDLRNKTTLDEVSWVMKQSLLHIDGESGMVRMARALHTKSVVLFGPTSKPFFCFDENINISPLVCGDCWWSTGDWLSQCPRGLPTPECMDTITPELVFKRVESYLKALGSPRYKAENLSLYQCESGKEFLADLCSTVHLPLVPISRHTEDRESGIYLHASKQWEYLKAWEIINAMAAELGRPLKIADIGGGRGALSAYLAKKGHEVEVFDIDYLWDHGGDLDIEYRFQKWATKNNLKVSYGSLFNVPAETAAYDIVLSISVLEHIPQKHFALKESLRLLRSGGKLILSFDFTENNKALEDTLRVEIFTPELLNATLSAVGIKEISCSSREISQSALRIQQDQVAGIPPGMTVGSLTITCLEKQNSSTGEETGSRSDAAATPLLVR